MNWLLGSPWPILTAGVLVEIVLIVALVRSGRGLILAAIAGVAGLTGVLLVVERMVVTEPEQVERELDGLSAALVENDLPAVLAHIAPDAADVRDQAQRHLPQVIVNSARVGADLTIKVDDRARPPKAWAAFTGSFQFKLVHGSSPHDRFIRRFRLRFVKAGERWLIDGVEDGGGKP